MQKDELIQFHMFLLQLKNHLEDITNNYNNQEFKTYNKLKVTPYKIYKSKREHELAIFLLSKGITNLLTYNNHPGLEKTSKKLNKTSERLITEKEKKLMLL